MAFFFFFLLPQELIFTSLGAVLTFERCCNKILDIWWLNENTDLLCFTSAGQKSAIYWAKLLAGLYFLLWC